MRFQYDADPTIRETVFQAMGFASVCWDSVKHAGTFNSTLAGEAGQEAITTIRSIVTFELSRLLDDTDTAKEWNAAIETAISRVETLA